MVRYVTGYNYIKPEESTLAANFMVLHFNTCFTTL